jgi:hypothetical protein
VFRYGLNGSTCRGVSHAHGAHQRNLSDTTCSAAIAGLDYGTVAQRREGMLPTDPDTVITGEIAGDKGGWIAIHQIQEGSHLGAVAELRLGHQPGDAVNMSALLAKTNKGILVFKGFSQRLTTGLQLLRQGLPAELSGST